ncbi:MAG TPA: dephospho-CoA kinase [Dehalococcoidia bacterium]|nr:dephospho-CoA kinase [Dehalococcoidia bacterium]
MPKKRPRSGKPYVIGVSGRTGSGKSTVVRVLEEKGAAVLEADLLAHQTYAPGTDGWREVVDAYGQEVIAPDGTIDRRRLAAIVFDDAHALARLNVITHDRTRQLIEQRLQELATQGVEVAVLEAALLFEASWDDLADEVWVTMAPLAVCAERAAEHLGISREEAMARIERQLPDESRIARADVIIDTSGSLLQTQEAADGEWERLQERLGADSAAKA